MNDDIDAFTKFKDRIRNELRLQKIYYFLEIRYFNIFAQNIKKKRGDARAGRSQPRRARSEKRRGLSRPGPVQPHKAKAPG